MNNIWLFIWTKRWYNVLKNVFENNYNISWVLILIQPIKENNVYHDKIISFCKKNNIHYETSKNIKTSQYTNFISENKIDTLFCVSWRFLINENCFNIPKNWIFVIHDSLLPKYRWFAPTNCVIINWENKTGLTLQKISKECDAWEILDQIEFNINDWDDAKIINDKLIKLYPQIILNNIDKIQNWDYKTIIQNEESATYTCKRIFEDWKIDFNKDINTISNLIRWLTWPYYWAYCYLENELIYIWEVEKIYKNYVWIIPWRVIEFYDNWVWVLCWDWNIIKIKKISKKGNKTLFEKPNKLLNSIKLTLK